MKLDYVINWMIFNTPQLYRGRNYSESRKAALYTLFISSAGWEWDSSGFIKLVDSNSTTELQQLPKNYFNLKLYYISLPSLSYDLTLRKDLEQLLLNQAKWYSFLSSGHEDDGVILQSSSQLVKEIITRAQGKVRTRGYNSVETAKEDSNIGESHIYPTIIGDYSNILSITADNIHTIQKDWLEGTVEVANNTIAYYTDETQYKFNEMYPGNLHQLSLEDWFEFANSQVNYCNQFIMLYNTHCNSI